MKKILFLPIFFAFFACKAQTPTIVSQPVRMLKWVQVNDSVRAVIYFQGTNDTLATQAYARGFAGGSLGQGYGIKVTGSTIAIDSANYRKVDSLYPVTDSTFILKLNGRVYSYKMRGAVFSFNGRIGAIVPADNDYAQYYPKLDSSYTDPSFIQTLSFAKLINIPQTLAGYHISDGVQNQGNAYSLLADVEANRPPALTNPGFFFGIDDSVLRYWNGARYLTVASGGGGLDSVYAFQYGLRSIRSGDTVKVLVDTTTLKSVFGSASGGIFQLYTKYGLNIAGTDTASVDTTIFVRFSDTLRNFASKSYVNSRGFLTTETDPVANAKIISLAATSARGINISGSTAQALSTNPSWTFTADTTYLATLLALKDTAAAIRASSGGGGISQVYNKYGTIITGGDSIAVDTTLFPRYKDTLTGPLATRTYVLGRGYLTTETDPIATAKTITLNGTSGKGINIAGLAGQTLGSSPTWTFTADTTYLATNSYVGRQGFLTTETDPVATAKTVTLNATAGRGVLITGTAGQTVGANPTWAFATDTSYLSTLLGLKDTALTLRGLITAKSSTIFNKYGTIISGGDSITVDTTKFTRFSDTTATLATKNYVTSRGYLTTETDPIALAKTITETQGYGVLIAGTAGQQLSVSPSWTFTADTSVLAAKTYVASNYLPKTGSYHLYVRNNGGTGDTSYINGHDSTIAVKPFRDSGALVIVDAPDGGLVFYAPTGGTGGISKDTASIAQVLTSAGDTLKVNTTSVPQYLGTQVFIPGYSPTTAGIMTVAKGKRLDSTVTAKVGIYHRMVRAPWTKDSIEFKGISLEDTTGKLHINLIGDTTHGLLWDIDASAYALPQNLGTGNTPTFVNGIFSALSTNGIPYYTASTGFSIAAANQFPTLNQNTTGTAANLSGTPALPNGTTATTQTNGDNSTKLATTAYVGTALAAYAPLASPTFTGSPAVPTATVGTNTTQAASTAFVQATVGSYAPLVSPALTGTPTVPNQTALSNNTAAANTAYVDGAVSTLNSSVTSSLALKAPLASPTFTGIPAGPTATLGTNTTQFATTAFVQAALTSAGSGVTTVNPFSSSSQTNGAGISGTTITFGPADATNPGMVTTGNQSFSGYKTFTNTIQANTSVILNGNTAYTEWTASLDNWAAGVTPIGGSSSNGANWYVSSETSGTWTPRFNISSTGKVQLMTYGKHTMTGTLGYGLGEDTAGNIIELTKGTDFAPGTAANVTGIVKSTTGTGALTTAVAADFPILNQSTTGTAANLSGTPNLPNGTTATTQTNGDNSTKLATTAYVGTALAPYAPLASPTFTGAPLVPTATTGTNTTQAASTAFVQTTVGSYAPLLSPALTGTPTAPTAPNTTNTTQVATTAFVQNTVAGLAPLASPALTGTPIAPTATAGTNTTQIATTAFATAAINNAAALHGVQWTQTANGTTNTNSTAQTTLLGTGVTMNGGGLTVPANALGVGSTIRFEGAAFVQFGTSGPLSIIMSSSSGTVSYQISGLPVNYNGTAEIDVLQTVTTAGTSGTSTVLLKMITSSGTFVTSVQGVAINTTVSNTYNMSTQWQTATSANSIQSQGPFVFSLNQ